MSTQIAATKLFAPPPRPEAVPRRRLLDRLDGGIERRLTLVSAPAGFGKTTLVSSWIANLGRPVAWLSIDSGDGDPDLFLEHLVAALAGVLPPGTLSRAGGPATPGSGSAAEGDVSAGGAATPGAGSATAGPVTPIALVNAVAQVPEPALLVLDDYHETDGGVDETMSFLLANLPAGFHVVIVTRTDPQLPLARLRARAQLTEIREADLRFRAEEAASFLTGTMGLDLPPDQIARLEERTEGWIAGLQLAALAVQERSGVDDRDAAVRTIEGFAGDHRYVLDYLLEEVLDGLDEAMRSFLLSTSILERMSAPLCDAVSGRSDSRDLLLKAERGNLFVIPLDDRREWYRYHHLFAGALRGRLELELADQVPAIHLRASDWFSRFGMYAQAIHHAFEGGDADRAAALLELVWPEMDENYHSAPWLRWVNRLPEEYIEVRPLLSLGLAWALLNRGDLDLAETWLELAETRLEKAAGAAAGVNDSDEESGVSGADRERLRALPGAIAAARAYRSLTEGRVEEAERSARRALDLPTDLRRATHRQGRALLGVARWSAGDLEAADAILEGFMHDMITAGNWTDAMIAFVLAEIRLDLGRLQSGVDACRRLLSLTEREAGATALAMGDIHRALADLYLERHHIELAGEHLERAEELGEHVTLPNWSYRLFRTQARMQRTRGNLEEALDLLEEAQRYYTPAPLPIPRPAAAERARLHICLGNLDAAEEWARNADSGGDRPSGTAPAPPPVLGPAPGYLREYECMTHARLLIARGKTADADRMLEAIQRRAEAAGRVGTTIEILVFRSLAQDSPEFLHSALLRAQPEGILRPFVDEVDALAPLLEHALEHGITPAITRRILNVRAGTEPALAGNRRLVEPLSEREIEVLQMLATELSGPQIAVELIVSLNTVRSHTKSIYAKLDVSSRRAALRRAEELGLL